MEKFQIKPINLAKKTNFKGMRDNYLDYFLPLTPQCTLLYCIQDLIMQHQVYYN